MEDSDNLVRQTPVNDTKLLATINATLREIEKNTVTAVLQVPAGTRTLKGAVYVNFGKGLSFATWLDHDLDHKTGLGWGVAVRKTI